MNKAGNASTSGPNTGLATASSNTTTTGSSENGPGTEVASFNGVPFGKDSFDPQGLFDFYDDSIYVTESGNTLFVTWESYTHGDEIYTSIAQSGQWVVRDKPVYSLAGLANDGDWSRYLAGNELAVVNRLANKSFMVRWNESGALTTQQALYKGWVAGDFSINVSDAFAIALHLPYGAPTGGARYSLFLPSDPAKPQVLTTATPQFTGALYAMDEGSSRIYEIQTTKTGQHLLDMYSMTHPKASSSKDVPVNTSPVINNAGDPLAQKLSAVPKILKVSPQGTIYTLTRTQTDRGTVSVTAYNQNLQPVAAWKQVKIANPYAQNVQLSVTSGTPHIYDVVNYHGQAALQEIDLK